tara:strand:+ start:3538 stop:4548 length:1011 start_codon:yes stop_codon:yes gene_type:complete
MIKEIITQLEDRQDLSGSQMEAVMKAIMTGEIQDADIERFLLGLNAKGIAETEITAAAQVMRDRSLKFDIGDGSHIDTCGTGGTGLNTFNCSTASAFVVAGGGGKVTKHGNKAISSQSGSADFLIEAGANISHDRDNLTKIFHTVGFIFLFAPLHHLSMKHVMTARKKINTKTIFNLLGPHTNPCGAKKQLLGVYEKDLLDKFTIVAKNLDMQHVLIVHGFDGLDEISITDSTYISELKDGKINKYEISPSDFGLPISHFDEIVAQSPQESLNLVQDAFAGENSAVQNMIALNAGAGFYLGNQVKSIAEGVELAFSTMDSGKAIANLEAYVSVSNS